MAMTHTFNCGACGTTVDGIQTLTPSTLLKVMEAHAEHCPGFPPAGVNTAEHDELERDFNLACAQKRGWRDRARASESVIQAVANSYPSSAFDESETYFDGFDRPTNRRLAREYLAEHGAPADEDFAALVSDARLLITNGTEDEVIAFLLRKPVDVIAKVSG